MKSKLTTGLSFWFPYGYIVNWSFDLLRHIKRWMTFNITCILYEHWSPYIFIIKSSIVFILCYTLVTVIVIKPLFLFTSCLSSDVTPNTNSSIRIGITIKVTYCLSIDLKYVLNTLNSFRIDIPKQNIWHLVEI